MNEERKTKSTMDAQENLMRKAQRFGLAFDEGRTWGGSQKRLEFTLVTWRELAMAALEYAKSITQ